MTTPWIKYYYPYFYRWRTRDLERLSNWSKFKPLLTQGLPKNTGVGSLSLLQWSSQPRNQTGVSCIAGGFFTSWASRGALRQQGQVQSNELLPASNAARLQTAAGGDASIQCLSLPTVFKATLPWSLHRSHSFPLFHSGLNKLINLPFGVE